MNRAVDPWPAGPSWRQVSVQFDDYPAAERTGVARLAPVMKSAETAGLVASWFFIRKAPCWRLRFLPSHDSTEQDAMTFVQQRLETLHSTGRISRWVETIYEPEVHAFGGAAAMNVAHHLFHQDSRHIIDYLVSDRAATSGSRSDNRRELSILLCSTVMRSAGQDWYEQGDVWARVTENRPLPSDMPLDRLLGMESRLQQLMIVDTGTAIKLAKADEPLRFIRGR